MQFKDSAIEINFEAVSWSKMYSAVNLMGKTVSFIKSQITADSLPIKAKPGR